MKLQLIVVAILVTAVAAACDTGSPTNVIVTIAPAPTLSASSTVDAPVTTAPPTVQPTSTPSVPFPITWSVREVTSADGQTTYLVDDPSVIRAAQQGYEQLREYYRFPNGLPTKEQIEKDLAQWVADPDRVRGAVEQIEYMRSKGGYWILPPLSAYQWTDKAEFSADGSQVNLILTAQTYHAEYFSLEGGEVTYTEDDQGFNVDVTMVYDEYVGRWRVLSETSSVQNRGPVVTVTPTP